MKRSAVENSRIPIFTTRFRELQGELSNTEFAEKLGISRQTVGFYCNGDRVPDAVTLIEISKKCNVSVDWLLGLIEYPDPVMEVKQIINATGLSDTAVKSLIRGPGLTLLLLDSCIGNTHFNDAAYALDTFLNEVDKSREIVDGADIWIEKNGPDNPLGLGAHEFWGPLMDTQEKLKYLRFKFSDELLNIFDETVCYPEIIKELQNLIKELIDVESRGPDDVDND